MIGDALQEIADHIKVCGLYATVNVDELDLPGALVTPAGIGYDRLSGDPTITTDIYLLAANNGELDTLNKLGDMLNQLRQVMPSSEAVPISLPLKNFGPNPVPGLLVTVPFTITQE